MFFDWVKDFTDAEIGRDYPLKSFTTIGTGGYSEYFILPRSVKDLKDVLFACKKFSVKPFILGRGSNVLFADGKLPFAVVSTLSLTSVKTSKDKVTVCAGVRLSEFISIMKKKGYCGFEGLCGIPSTVGGAVVMNAGAFGFSISDYLYGVTVLSDGGIKYYTKKECRFGYRKSVFKTDKFLRKNAAVISADFVFPKISENYSDETEKYKAARKESQPVGKTFGSVFKNGKDFKVGALLEGAGLKGLKIGDAGFSDKHANFIVNYGKATSSDVYSLIKTAKNAVFDKYGVKIDEEVILVGDFK